MSSQKYVLVSETGLARGTYGAAISCSEPMDRAAADELLVEVVAGRRRDIFKRGENATVLRAAEGQYLVVEEHGLKPRSLARFTVAETVD